MIKPYFLKIICCLFISQSLAQPIQELNSGGKISLRGLSVVDNNIIWVSGSKGTVGKSLDGGKTWKWMKVKGYKKFDFRDIEAFDDNTAIIMAVASPAYILKTTDGGKKWKKVYENKTKGMFLDAMDFSDEKNGVVVGDPLIANYFYLVRTTDGGDTWLEVIRGGGKADSSEACFASSGTNIRLLKDRFVFVSGGLSSNLIINRKGKDVFEELVEAKQLIQKIKLPLIQGTSSTGANSIAVKDSLTYIVVGGDFTNDAAIPNCAITTDGGQTWTLPEKGPTGYKSCAEYLYGNVWVCCGLTGIDVSNDNGKTWNQISKVSYHTCRKAKKGNAVYFSGNGSMIGKFATRER